MRNKDYYPDWQVYGAAGFGISSILYELFKQC